MLLGGQWDPMGSQVCLRGARPGAGAGQLRVGRPGEEARGVVFPSSVK